MTLQMVILGLSTQGSQTGCQASVLDPKNQILQRVLALVVPKASGSLSLNPVRELLFQVTRSQASNRDEYRVREQRVSSAWEDKQDGSRRVPNSRVMNNHYNLGGETEAQREWTGMGGRTHGWLLSCLPDATLLCSPLLLDFFVLWIFLVSSG